MAYFRVFSSVILLSILLLAGAFGLITVIPPDSTSAQGVTVKKERIVVNIPSGSSVTGTTNTVIQGRILRVDLDYGTGLTSVTQLTIAQKNELVANNIVVNSGSSTDASFYPAVQLTTITGAGVTYDGTNPVRDYFPVADLLNIYVAASEAATPAVTVDIYWVE